MKISNESISHQFKASNPDLRPLLLYLAAPAILFLLSFIKAPVGVPATALLLLALGYSMRGRGGEGGEGGEGSERAYWLSAGLGAVITLLLIGFMSGPLFLGLG